MKFVPKQEFCPFSTHHNPKTWHHLLARRRSAPAEEVPLAKGGEAHTISKHQFWVLHSSHILGNILIDGPQFDNLRIATHQRPSVCSVCTALVQLRGAVTLARVWGSHLLVLVGESEPLNGVLDSTTAHTAQPVLQLQQLLWHSNSNKAPSALILGTRPHQPTIPAGDQGSLLPFPS